MNVYEEAHNLSKAIRESNEYREFDRLRKEIEQDEQLSSMIKDFERKQLEMQAKQMTGGQMDQDLMTQVQSMYTMVAGNPKAAEYLQAEARLAVMVKDVYEILADAMKITM